MKETETQANDEIEAAIRALPVTYDAVVGGEEDAMDPGDRLEMEAHFELARRGHPTAITVYRRLARTYPGVPVLKNHLFVAFSAAGRMRQAEEILEETYRLHPEYLFARINLAIDRIQGGQPGEARRYLGESLQIPELPPSRGPYHHSEIRSWYVAVAMLHLAEGRIGAARAIHRALVAILGDEDRGVLQLGRDIGQHNLREFQLRMAEDRARAVRVTVPRRERPRNPVFLPPSFHHREIEALYCSAIGEAPPGLETLLALPRGTLVRDLEAVLHDFLERGWLFAEGTLPNDDEATSFPFHAMLLLGELGAVDSLPLILEALCEEEEVMEFFFGDWLFQLDRPVRQLASDRIDETAAWVLAPGRACEPRGLVARGLAGVAHDDPAKRGAVIAWFRRVIEALLAATPEGNVLDTLFVSNLVCEAMSLRAVELRPEVERLYEKGLVSLSFAGDLEDYDRAMTEVRNRPDFRPLAPLAEFYRGLGRGHGWSDRGDEVESGGVSYLDEEFFALPPSDLDRLEARFSGPLQIPSSAGPKVGRNDPCPCGSGKKFKKCCG